jgi:hypothetical protein
MAPRLVAIAACDNLSRARRRITEGLTLLLLAYFALRLALVVTAEPIIGFANNFDFMRQSACVGVWQDYPDRAKDSWHWEGPVAALRYDGDRRYYECGWAADNLFPWLAAHRHALGDRMDLREVGAAKLAALLLLAICLVFSQATAPARLASAAVLVAVAGDFDALSFLNTLYVETTAIGALCGLLISGAALLSAARPPGWRALCLPALLLACLGLDKQQWGPFVILLGAALAMSLAWRWRAHAKAATVLAVALLAPLVLTKANEMKWGVLPWLVRANHLHVFYGAVWPAAPDPDAALRILGLPPACAVPRTPQSLVAAAKVPPCEEAALFNRSRLAALALTQPAAVARPLLTGLVKSQPTRKNPLARLPSAAADTPRASFLRLTSITYWLACLPPPAYALLTGGVILGAILAGAALALKRPRRAPSFCAALFVLSGLTGAYAVFSAVFGDGYEEIWRHALLLPLSTGSAILALLVLAASTPNPLKSKVFCFFFPKKKRFLPWPRT